ncbi:MAG: oligosaccharide flippase family protein [Cocleimonas sp.]
MNRQAIKNLTIYGGVNGFKSLVPLLMLPILTTHLSANDFAALSLIETTVLIITPFILMNIQGSISVEYYHLSKDELGEYIVNALILSCCFFFLFFLIITVFSDFLYSIFDIKSEILQLILVFGMLRVVTTVVLGLHHIRSESNRFALLSILQIIIDFSLSFYFVVILNLGSDGRLGGVYGAFMICSLIGIIELKKMGYLNNVSFRYTKKILSFGLPMIPHAIGGTIIAMSDRYFIHSFQGSEQLALYVVAYQVSAVMLLVGVTVNQVWVPILFPLLKSNYIKKSYYYLLLISIAFIGMSVLIILLKDLLFYLFVGVDFIQAKIFFEWLLLGFLFQSLYMVVSSYLFFYKKTKKLATLTVFSAILNAILNYYLIGVYGTIGAAYASVAVWIVFFILTSFMVLKSVWK